MLLTSVASNIAAISINAVLALYGWAWAANLCNGLLISIHATAVRRHVYLGIRDMYCLHHAVSSRQHKNCVDCGRKKVADCVIRNSLCGICWHLGFKLWCLSTRAAIPPDTVPPHGLYSAIPARTDAAKRLLEPGLSQALIPMLR